MKINKTTKVMNFIPKLDYFIVKNEYTLYIIMDNTSSHFINGIIY